MMRGLGAERPSVLSAEGLLNGGHGDEQLAGMFSQWNEFVVFIEACRGIIDRFGNNPNGSHLHGILPTAVEGIHQHDSTELPALTAVPDGEPAEQRRGKERILGKLLGQLGWNFGRPD